MAAKTLREALFTALTEQNIDLTENQIRNIEGELRDYFFHEIPRILGSPPRDGTEREKNDWQIHYVYLTAYFNKIFKNISAVKGEKND